MTENEKKLLRELIKICREKDYSDDSIFNIFFFCGCDQMHEAGYVLEDVLKIAIELVKTKPKAEVYTELLKLTGYES